LRGWRFAHDPPTPLGELTVLSEDPLGAYSPVFKNPASRALSDPQASDGKTPLTYVFFFDNSDTVGGGCAVERREK